MHNVVNAPSQRCRMIRPAQQSAQKYYAQRRDARPAVAAHCAVAAQPLLLWERTHVCCPLYVTRSLWLSPMRAPYSTLFILLNVFYICCSLFLAKFCSCCFSKQTFNQMLSISNYLLLAYRARGLHSTYEKLCFYFLFGIWIGRSSNGFHSNKPALLAISTIWKRRTVGENYQFVSKICLEIVYKKEKKQELLNKKIKKNVNVI